MYLLGELLGTVLASLVAALAFGIGKTDVLPSYIALFENEAAVRGPTRTLSRPALVPSGHTKETMV